MKIASYGMINSNKEKLRCELFNQMWGGKMKRQIQEVRRGFNGMDGAGVHLVRVLSQATIKKLDPFLMLDVFDSDNYEDYIAGFTPWDARESSTFALMHNRIYLQQMYK